MKTRLFTPSDVNEVLGISLRRITNFAEKGLIVPAKEASGAGSKRLYDYINVLEFALAEELFRLGLGIHLIKSILHQIRIDRTLHAWAEDFSSHFLSLAEHYKQHFLSLAAQRPEDEELKALLEKPFSAESIKDDFVKRGPLGILMYFSNIKGETMAYISPVDMKFALGVPFIMKNFAENDSGIFVNLGRIKKRVDRRIELKIGTQ